MSHTYKATVLDHFPENGAVSVKIEPTVAFRKPPKFDTCLAMQVLAGFLPVVLEANANAPLLVEVDVFHHADKFAKSPLLSTAWLEANSGKFIKEVAADDANATVHINPTCAAWTLHMSHKPTKESLPLYETHEFKPAADVSALTAPISGGEAVVETTAASSDAGFKSAHPQAAKMLPRVGGGVGGGAPPFVGAGNRRQRDGGDDGDQDSGAMEPPPSPAGGFVAGGFGAAIGNFAGFGSGSGSPSSSPSSSAASASTWGTTGFAAGFGAPAPASSSTTPPADFGVKPASGFGAPTGTAPGFGAGQGAFTAGFGGGGGGGAGSSSGGASGFAGSGFGGFGNVTATSTASAADSSSGSSSSVGPSRKHKLLIPLHPAAYYAYNKTDAAAVAGKAGTPVLFKQACNGAVRVGVIFEEAKDDAGDASVYCEPNATDSTTANEAEAGAGAVAVQVSKKNILGRAILNENLKRA